MIVKNLDPAKLDETTESLTMSGMGTSYTAIHEGDDEQYDREVDALYRWIPGINQPTTE